MDPNFHILITKDIIVGSHFRGHDYEFYYSWIHRIIIRNYVIISVVPVFGIKLLLH